MQTKFKLGSLFGIVAVLALGGCATPNTQPYSYNRDDDRQRYDYRNQSDYGVIQSIEAVPQDNAGNRIGLGTIAGAVVGGVVGNQVGSGRGNTAATVLGAAGGAYIGHEIENRQQRQVDAYRINIRMDDGSYQALMQDSYGDLRAGDRIRVESGVVQRY